jgi:hypothetical protein
LVKEIGEMKHDPLREGVVEVVGAVLEKHLMILKERIDID